MPDEPLTFICTNCGADCAGPDPDKVIGMVEAGHNEAYLELCRSWLCTECLNELGVS